MHCIRRVCAFRMFHVNSGLKRLYRHRDWKLKAFVNNFTVPSVINFSISISLLISSLKTCYKYTVTQAHTLLLAHLRINSVWTKKYCSISIAMTKWPHTFDIWKLQECKALNTGLSKSNFRIVNFNKTILNFLVFFLNFVY